ncbi:PREDICTED: RPM1-interacting protein 4 isoform X3 [Tarenaya hassleriana]|uniref:RPM1-interacting protein 4 isoform X3 n=1 Tax=Tarenaya hassleriana TaxID=28532 RepID=UPI00053C2009|nr:PREDICTED: RPM1-interacting protein 4 isoform X3 [Tarenaya hassleriana]
MATQDKGRPLPKFGEWDVSNPASAEGFTVIFNKARDEKKTKKTSVAGPDLVSPPRNEDPNPAQHHGSHNSKSKKWLCFR